jgi:hypothetical protein
MSNIDEELIREAVRVALDEVKTTLQPSPPSAADMRDAWDVFRDWLSIGDPYMKSKFGLHYIDDVKQQFFSQSTNVVKLPISSVETFADFGRRPGGSRLKNTIVVVQIPGAKSYQVLDGQHRVHQLRSQGVKTVNAAVIVLTKPKSTSDKVTNDVKTKKRSPVKKTGDPKKKRRRLSPAASMLINAPWKKRK